MAETVFPKTSIIVVHWAQDANRSFTMYRSVNSLIQTTKHLPVEIIVVDNGDSMADSGHLLQLVNQHDIACYVRNRKNMSFGYARNQALKLCSGEFIVISDNDIFYKEGWLEECVGFLQRNQGKYLATPLSPDPMNRRQVRWRGEVDGWKLNERAGSNCWVMRKEDYETIGGFEQHRIAGSRWTDKYNRLGYLMACMPEPRAEDLAFRKGYNFKEDIPNYEL